MKQGPSACQPLPGIVLAAGLSRRMGSCKLTLPFHDRPVLARVLEAALTGGLDPLILVYGPHSPDFTPIVDLARANTQNFSTTILCVCAPDAALGQAHSLQSGITALLSMDAALAPATVSGPNSQASPAGVMVLLGDQPLITANLIRDLTALFFQESATGPCCAAPVFQQKRGNPVVLHASLFPEIMKLAGDTGARSLLATLPLRLLSCHDDSYLADMDDRQAYHALLTTTPHIL